MAALAAACVSPPSAPILAPGPGGGAGEPTLLVGLISAAPRLQIGGGDALRLRTRDARTVTDLGRGQQLAITPDAAGLVIADDAGRDPVAAPVVISADADGFVRVNGRDYRGTIEVRRSGATIQVVERVGIESYLAGVVSAELGDHPEGDDQAAMAQAVVSRTYAVRNAGRWRAQGFDLAATVGDQRYDGVHGETPQAWRAVRATRGQILTWEGQPIDAFFHSTCGGRTADASEVFSGGRRPYLRSVADVDGDGLAYCRISPRYQWREEWSAEALVAALRRTLPAEAGVRQSEVTEVRGIEVSGHTPSGRVARLTIQLGGRTVTVAGAAVRRVLLPPGQDVLRSAVFTLQARMASGRVVGLVADGRGAGHGVGLCQWGAIGRARAGQRYPQILSAYFPGTKLTRQF
ncbi:MAG: SpoIID/LytB domain-containing protein [Gemmatimonadales bacterium]